MATDEELLLIRIEATQTKMEKELNKAISNLDRADKKIARSQSKLTKQIEQSWSHAGSTIRTALGSIGVALSVREIADYADKWIAATNALKVAGLEGSSLTTVMDNLFASAQKNSVAFNPLVGVYAKIAQVQGELGASTEDLTTFTNGVALSLKVAGTSAGAASGALLQLGQLLGGQKVQAQEYNSIIDGAYPLLQAVAAGSDKWGGSVAKLTQDVKAGKVSVQEFFHAAMDGFPTLASRAGKAQVTISQALQKLDNAFEKFVGAASGPAVNAITGGLDELATHLDDVVKAATVAGAALGAAGLVKGVTAAVTAVRTLTAAILAMEGVALGPAVAVVAAIAAAVYIYGGRVDDVTVAIDKEKKAHDDLNRVLGIADENNKKLAQSTFDAQRAKLLDALNTAKQAEAQAKLNVQQLEAARIRTQSPYAIAKGIGPGTYDQAAIDRAKKRLTDLQAAAKQAQSDLDKLGTYKIVPNTPPSHSTSPAAAAAVTGGMLSDQSGVLDHLNDDATDEFNKKIAAQNEVFMRAAAGADELHIAQKETADNTDATKQAIDNLRFGLVDLGEAGLHGFSSLKDAAASFLETIENTIVKLYIMQPILNGLFGSGKSGDGGLIGDLLGVPGFASGTNYAPGGLAIVGERGPELVNLPRGSQVIPSIPTIRASGGGTTVVQQFDLRGAMVDKDVWAQVNQIAASHAANAGKAAVAVALKPHVLGPAMDKAKGARAARSI